MTLSRRGDLAGARAAYRYAADSRHPQAASMAAWRLADLDAPQVGQPYQVVLARGADDQLAAVDRASHSEVHAAIGALAAAPKPSGTGGHDLIMGPFHSDAGGHRITWMVNDADRTVLVMGIARQGT